MGHQDLNYWKNKDGTLYCVHECTYDISCASNRAVRGGDFEIMVFHVDGTLLVDTKTATFVYV